MNDITLRPVSELDIDSITAIDEKITGKYKPEQWENRIAYYLRRDPETSLVALKDDGVVGFMLGEVRSGEFGLEEPSGWIEALGVDPGFQGKAIGGKLLEGMLQNFRARGATAVRTLVNEESQAELLRFFEKSKFAATPIRTLEYAF